ncbi:hypothetical protein K1719_033454 [Acacia pycnantha]|nr:hypothetical protein K1719_033454 [Acacia pycnantha]
MYPSQLTYDVSESDKLYKKTMMYCGERWTEFKTNLAKNYVHIKVKGGKPRPDPCRKYSYLDEETWKEFCRIRTTPEALVS